MSNITDWLMVIITGIYVIATIVICRANLSSARATQEQLIVYSCITEPPIFLKESEV